MHRCVRAFAAQHWDERLESMKEKGRRRDARGKDHKQNEACERALTYTQSIRENNLPNMWLFYAYTVHMLAWTHGGVFDAFA